MKPRERISSYLSPPDFHRLEWACRPIVEAFGTPPYLVGSVLARPDFRDIDLRLILDDSVVEAMFALKGDWTDGNPEAARLLVNIALSDLITKAANPPAPIDFQIQSMTEANVPEHGRRNPMGIRDRVRTLAARPDTPTEPAPAPGDAPTHAGLLRDARHVGHAGPIDQCPLCKPTRQEPSQDTEPHPTERDLTAAFDVLAASQGNGDTQTDRSTLNVGDRVRITRASRR